MASRAEKSRRGTKAHARGPAGLSDSVGQHSHGKEEEASEGPSQALFPISFGTSEGCGHN